METQPPLRFIAPLNHTMPFISFEHGQLRSGIVKDLSDEVARRLGRSVEYLPVPPRRVGQVLAAGEADGVCYLGKGWIDGSFHWSPPVLDHIGVIAGLPEAPSIGSLGELAGMPLGTVHAYRYPQFEQALGKLFVRDDAPSMLANLRKLVAHRMRYALTELITLQYYNREHPQDGLKVAMETAHYRTYCAFTFAHKLPLDKLDEAVSAMVREGAVDRILERYR
ncbi:MAG: transporter substrate-binding domain-containing protein [Paucibacter sp.]|nr:transporter substrate-binding domain-containing protein [Roseateles sp.]